MSEKPFNAPDYWNQESLEQYSMTFGERIAWKWNSVLKETLEKGFKPQATVWDWGCGTGAAAFCFLRSYLKLGEITQIHLTDRSQNAQEFAAEKIRTEFPTVKISSQPPESSSKYTLLLSHVANEINEAEFHQLQRIIQHSQSLVWVEPGTPAANRRLLGVRSDLKDKFQTIAPCPHQVDCPTLKPENVKHWCHFFSEIPDEVFHDRGWRKFSERLSIDLRSLPVSFWVADRRLNHADSSNRLDRLIGRARIYKGYALALLCGSDGNLIEKKFLTRDNKQLIKRLDTGGFNFEILESEKKSK